jgi:hypothetical protein
MNETYELIVALARAGRPDDAPAQRLRLLSPDPDWTITLNDTDDADIAGMLGARTARIDYRGRVAAMVSSRNMVACSPHEQALIENDLNPLLKWAAAKAGYRAAMSGAGSE